ncbi:MAG: hypothetical protein FWF90_16720 [Promicromonosporaceae bacterium]|nr:hypothetical protein [Promicromonosporaceae bacterium]
MTVPEPRWAPLPAHSLAASAPWLFGDGGPVPPERLAAPARALAAVGGTRPGERLDTRYARRDRVLAAVFEAVRVRRPAGERRGAHRVSPTRRALFGADLHVCAADGRSWWVDPEGLVLRGEGVVAPELSAATVTVHPDRLLPAYGSLRGPLALLEAGHLAATLALTAWRAGLSPQVVVGVDGACVLRVDLRDDDPEGDGAVGRLDSCTAPPADTLASWLDRRSSGWPAPGPVARDQVDGAGRGAVAGAIVAALEALRDVVPQDDALRVYEQRLADGWGAATDLQRVDRSGPVVRVDGATGFPASSGVTLTARYDAWLDAYGSDASTVLHATVGWLTQWGCLAAAAHRVTSRPVRPADATEWGRVLGLPAAHVPVHQLWLRSWPDDDAAPEELGR